MATEEMYKGHKKTFYIYFIQMYIYVGLIFLY